MASGAYTHTHTLWQNESDYKKPGAPACSRRAPGLKNQLITVKETRAYRDCINSHINYYIIVRVQIVVIIVIGKYVRV